MVPREVQPALASKIQLRVDGSRRLLDHDRSFVYSRVQAYIVAAQNVANTHESHNVVGKT
jgi:hypothetical protein